MGVGQAQQTHCKRGHPLSGENLKIVTNDGRKYRRCRECARAPKKCDRDDLPVFDAAGTLAESYTPAVRRRQILLEAEIAQCRHMLEVLRALGTPNARAAMVEVEIDLVRLRAQRVDPNNPRLFRPRPEPDDDEETDGTESDE